MAQQTAVEWLQKEWQKKDIDISIRELWQQAKAMEKEQMLDAYNSDRYPWSKQDALKYYNETYNK